MLLEQFIKFFYPDDKKSKFKFDNFEINSNTEIGPPLDDAGQQEKTMGVLHKKVSLKQAETATSKRDLDRPVKFNYPK